MFRTDKCRIILSGLTFVRQSVYPTSGWYNGENDNSRNNKFVYTTVERRTVLGISDRTTCGPKRL